MVLSSGRKNNGGGVMSYFCLIQAVVAYLENRLKTEIDYQSLAKVTGFSLTHARTVFQTCTGMPLARYILYRKIANAAFEMIHTQRSILEIALDYGFESYDTFTRAFKRVAGVTPSQFRKSGCQVGRIKLTARIYGPGLTQAGTDSRTLPPDSEETLIMKTVEKCEDSCILYGVPRVRYCREECTPFPSVLKACLNYMGQKIGYSHLMAVSGAAFRLRWNSTGWDGGNVDIAVIYANPNEAYERSFQAAGRDYQILERGPDGTKADFIRLIKSELDMGRPVIATGIIGPPEACIITGYRDGGRTLLGWNFFQENPEFAKSTQTDPSGYFICKNWWENPDTTALMAIGETKRVGTSIEDILVNAIAIMSRERVGEYAGGPAAFDAWAGALAAESQFPRDAVLPLLFERLMCQLDAMDMIREGRSYAACFMEWVAGQDESLKDTCLEAAAWFKKEANVVNQMSGWLGGWRQGEKQARNLVDSGVRQQLVKLIAEAKQYDVKACGCLKEIVNRMNT
jgi:AraC-like DNA-binding protein